MGAAVQEAGTQVVEWAAVEMVGAAGLAARAAAVTVAATRGLGIWAAVEAGVAVETVVWGSAVACAAVREAVAKAVAVQGPET